MFRERDVPAIRAAPLPFQPSGLTFHRRGGRAHCFQYRLCVLLRYALSSPRETIFALTTEHRALQSYCSRTCFSSRVFLLHAIFPATLTAFSPPGAFPLVPSNGRPLSISIRSPERARRWPARSPMLESCPVSGHYRVARILIFPLNCECCSASCTRDTASPSQSLRISSHVWLNTVTEKSRTCTRLDKVTPVANADIGRAIAPTLEE